MYESHFGLLRRPFLATPDPDCFVCCEAADNALAGLRLCIEGGKGFGILSAPAGTGKTLLCRKLIVDLRDQFATVFLANSNFPTRRSLLQAILYELGRPYMRMAEQELRLELQTAAAAIRPDKQAVLLVVDEAHLLGHHLLEELRTAANIDQDGTPLIHVVLSGQLELEETLIGPELDALNQRVGCQVTLESLTREESAMYVAHRLQWAGAAVVDDVIHPEALEVICHAADGLPRCLNQLCDHSLLLAYVADERPASEATVREALEDLKQLPLHWNEPSAVSSPLEQLRTEAAAKEAAHAEPDMNVMESEPDREECSDHDTAETLAADAAVEQNVIEVGETASVEVGAPVAVESEAPTADTAPAAAVLEVGATDSVAADTVEPARVPIEALAEKTVNPSAAMFPSVPAALVREPVVAEDASGFEEEVVVDRYAMLDAGLPIVGPTTTAADDGATTSPPQPPMECGYELTAARTPEQLLDAIEPLIDQVLNDDRACDIEAAAVSEPLAGGLVDRVGDDVPPVTDEPAEYDVVQPEESVVPTNAEFPAENRETAARKSQGRYAQLFSKLRRQQRRSA